MLSWCQSGIAELPRKVFRLKRITPETFPLFAHYVGRQSSFCALCRKVFL